MLEAGAPTETACGTKPRNSPRMEIVRLEMFDPIFGKLITAGRVHAVIIRRAVIHDVNLGRSKATLQGRPRSRPYPYSPGVVPTRSADDRRTSLVRLSQQIIIAGRRMVMLPIAYEF